MKVDRHVYSRVDFKWDGLALRLKSGRLLVTVEPDSNITWAKDAAIAIACADLNKWSLDISHGGAALTRPND